MLFGALLRMLRTNNGLGKATKSDMEPNIFQLIQNYTVTPRFGEMDMSRLKLLGDIVVHQNW